MAEKRIYLSSPHMSAEGYELQYILEAFETNWIAPLGKNVDEFEREFAEKKYSGEDSTHFLKSRAFSSIRIPFAK